MSQKFIIAIDEGTPEQNDAITLFIQRKGWHVWHWMNDIWLLAGVPDDVTAWKLTGELNDPPYLGAKGILVMKIDGESRYSGWLDRGAWTWLGKYWGEPDPISDTAPTITLAERG